MQARKFSVRQWSVPLLVSLLIMLVQGSAAAQAAEAGVAEGMAPRAVELTLADPPRILNYQGYLTNGSGAPVSGPLTMQAALFDGPDSENLRWGPETFTDVPVANGLFQLALGSTVALAAEVFAGELWVEIRIDATTLPRQPLRPAPYAFGLTPGAHVVGTPVDSDYGLLVANLAEVESSTGIYARGYEVGVYADTTMAGGLGLFTPKAIEATGGYRGPDTMLHISPLKGRAWDDFSGSLLTTNVGNNGSLLLRSSEGTCPCLRIFYIPIDAPSVLYGQDVTIKEIALQYRALRAENSSTAITRVSLLQLQDLTQSTDLLISESPLASIAPITTVFMPGNARLNADSGSVTLRLEITFANNTDFINLGNIRVRLGHTP